VSRAISRSSILRSSSVSWRMRMQLVDLPRFIGQTGCELCSDQGRFSAVSVFFELARDLPAGPGPVPFHAIPIQDVLRHTRLADLDRLVGYLGAIKPSPSNGPQRSRGEPFRLRPGGARLYARHDPPQHSPAVGAAGRRP
jgi:hypothetical protein